MIVQVQDGKFVEKKIWKKVVDNKDKKVIEKKVKLQVKKKVVVDDQGEFVNFNDWKDVVCFMDEMVECNQFQCSDLNVFFVWICYVDSVIQLIKLVFSIKFKNWVVYWVCFVELVCINVGVDFWNIYGVVLVWVEV